MPEGFILVRVLRVKANETIYPTATEASEASYGLATTIGGEYAVVHESYEVDEPSPVDWEALLTKYVELIVELEGITFISYADLAKFTEPELDALRAIRDKARNPATREGEE